MLYFEMTRATQKRLKMLTALLRKITCGSAFGRDVALIKDKLKVPRLWLSEGFSLRGNGFLCGKRQYPLFELTNFQKCDIMQSLHSLIKRSKFTFGKKRRLFLSYLQAM